jgi:hypothetical protein
VITRRSGPICPARLTRIDDLTRPDHLYLDGADECFYFGDYCARQGFGYSPMNRLIYNFKKPMDRRDQPDWFYKEQAIDRAAAAFSEALPQDFCDRAVFVAMPPSKARDDAGYDDRVFRLLQRLGALKPCNVHDLLRQDGSRDVAAHQGQRLDPDTLAGMLRVEALPGDAAPSIIGLFDDVLVTGASFKAAKAVLGATYPGVRVVGLYIARRVFPPMEENFVVIGEDV